MIILGIETSCDDTATALVRDGRDVLSSVSTNQDAFHAKYGGIVPEIASRQHVALLSAAVDDALGRAGMTFADVDAIGVTRGPGLIGSLVVGVASAKALAFALDKPLYAVNHLHGHIFAAFLDGDEEPPYPFLALLVSGGHSQLVDVRSATEMRVIGRTRDDAAGEAFDKGARMLGLGYPGGAALERLAAGGAAHQWSGQADQRPEPPGPDLDTQAVGHHLLDVVRLVEDDHLVVYPHAVILARTRTGGSSRRLRAAASGGCRATAPRALSCRSGAVRRMPRDPGPGVR